MNTTETASGIPEEIKAQFQQTLDDLAKGIRRPDKMKAACERMDRMREKTVGTSANRTSPLSWSAKPATGHEIRP